MDWASLGTLAGLVVASASFVTLRLDRRFDAERTFNVQHFHAIEHRLDLLEHRFELLEERYVRHLDLHSSR